MMINNLLSRTQTSVVHSALSALGRELYVKVKMRILLSLCELFVFCRNKIWIKCELYVLMYCVSSRCSGC